MAKIEDLIGPESARKFRTASINPSGQKITETRKIDIKRKQVLEKIKRAEKKVIKKKVKKTSETRSLARYIQGTDDEKEFRSLGLIENNGKILLSKKLSNKVITYVQEHNPLRRLGTVSNEKKPKEIIYQSKKANANIVSRERDENNLMDSSVIEFDSVLLEPIELDGIAKFTKKLEKMSEIEIETMLVEELGKAILRKEIEWCIHPNKNDYSLSNKAVSYVHHSLSKNLYEHLLGMKNAVPINIRKKATWLINRAAQTEIESLLDGNGNPIMKNTGNEDFQYRIFNMPAEVSDGVDYFDEQTGLTDPTIPIIYFGDFSYFKIQDVLGKIEIQRLSELFAAENKIGVSVYELLDGKLVFGPFEIVMFKMNIKDLK